MKTLAWKQITAALVIGFLLGGGFSMWQARQGFGHWMRYPKDQKKERLLKRFVTELRLTDSQKAQVENILGSTMDQMEALRAEMHPKFKALRGEMRHEIRAILTDQQQKRFETMETEWDARRGRFSS